MHRHPIGHTEGVKVMSPPLPPACRRDQGTPCPARGVQTHSIPPGPCTASPPGPPHIPARDPAIPPPIPTRAKAPRSPISHGGGEGGGVPGINCPFPGRPRQSSAGAGAYLGRVAGAAGGPGGGSAGDGGTDGAALRSATQPGSGGGGGGAHGRGCAPCLQPPVAMATEGWSRCLQRLQKSAGEDEGGMMDTPPSILSLRVCTHPWVLHRCQPPAADATGAVPRPSPTAQTPGSHPQCQAGAQHPPHRAIRGAAAPATGMGEAMGCSQPAGWVRVGVRPQRHCLSLWGSVRATNGFLLP